MFTAVYEKQGDCWAAYVEEITGVNTQGATKEEAEINLREALEMVLQANRDLARKSETANVIREPLLFEA